MNPEEKDYNIGTYKATGNLNTVISNPSANINNAMDVNIKTMNTGMYNPSDNTPNNVQPSININTMPINNVQDNNNLNTVPVNNAPDNNVRVTKKYVNVNDEPKKKKFTLNIGKEFKIALLIIVILLVFIFFIDLIPSLF